MIHKFELLGQHIVLDVESGAVLRVSKQVYELVGVAEQTLSEGRTEPPIELQMEETEAWNEIIEMYRAGLLFSEPEVIEPAVISVLGFAPVKALCLHVAHDCNLRCKYCFASTGDFGTGRMLMDAETACRAIDFVVKRSGARRNIEIDFFGGEPLLAMETVKATVEYAKRIPKKNFRFTITTNGVALDDETINYINSEMSNVVLSLDGRREVNDAMRPTPNGKGSFDLIVPKFRQLVDARKPSGKDYYIRGTFTKQNVDFSEDVIEMARLGFEQISVEPVVAEDLNNYSSVNNYSIVQDYALTEDDLPAIFAEYERLLEHMIHDNSFNFFHFNIDLEQGPCIVKRVRGCGAGYEYVAVTPEGDIYPCHQFVGREEYRMGSVHDGTFDTDIARRFGLMNIYTRSDCKTCWAKYYCSGGCSAANLAANGSIDKAYKMGCELERKRIECAIVLKLHRNRGLSTQLPTNY